MKTLQIIIGNDTVLGPLKEYHMDQDTQDMYWDFCRKLEAEYDIRIILESILQKRTKIKIWFLSVDIEADKKLKKAIMRKIKALAPNTKIGLRNEKVLDNP